MEESVVEDLDIAVTFPVGAGLSRIEAGMKHIRGTIA